jgi:hypothetical protein
VADAVPLSDAAGVNVARSRSRARLALIVALVALVACTPAPATREPIANTAPPIDAARPTDANPCDVFFILSQHALECQLLDPATRARIQSITDSMVGAVSERGLDEDQDAPERECAEATAQTRKLAAACQL